jgi:DNA/RNA endonuclease YhcR with UshA esterase domain
MKHTLTLFFLLLLSLSTFAQTEIQANEAKNHLGKVVMVKAKVGGVRESPAEGKPHYINLGADYPNQDLTIAVFGDFEAKYKLKVSDLQGKTIEVKGVVSEYRGRVQLKDPESIVVVAGE